MAAPGAASSSRGIVQLLFPMGGLGTRFAAVGITTPKPLIEVDEGVPMINKAVSSFAGLAESGVDVRPIFVIRREHVEQFDFQRRIEATVPNAVFAILESDTRGAAETCMIAESLILPDSPLVVMDCDLYFRSRRYLEFLVAMASGSSSDTTAATTRPPSGVLVYFESSAPRYSFAALAEDGITVTQTAEKKPISTHALIGAYGFASGDLFKAVARELLDQPIDEAAGRKEYYVSLLFNYVLRRPDATRVVAVPHDEYFSFGTPEELASYKSHASASHVAA